MWYVGYFFLHPKDWLVQWRGGLKSSTEVKEGRCIERRNPSRIARPLWISQVQRHFLAAISPRHIASPPKGGYPYISSTPNTYFLLIIGSGRVTFNNTRSFMKAVQASFIEIRSPKFNKKVQIDPYLEDAMCSQCHINPGTYISAGIQGIMNKNGCSLFPAVFRPMFPVPSCFGSMFPVPGCFRVYVPSSRLLMGLFSLIVSHSVP